MLFASCDIGLKGFFTVLNKDGELVWYRPMPLEKNKLDWHGLKSLIDDLDDFATQQFETVVIGIEKPLSLPSDTGKIKKLFESYVYMPRFCMADMISAELKKTDGRVGTLTTGTNYGILLGLVLAKGWKYQVIPPRTWQKKLHENTDFKYAAKIRSAQAAHALWPGQDFKVGRMKKEHDGFIDAILIAEYCRRSLR